MTSHTPTPPLDIHIFQLTQPYKNSSGRPATKIMLLWEDVVRLFSPSLPLGSHTLYLHTGTLFLGVHTISGKAVAITHQLAIAKT